jgi:hypothetical protein
MQTEDFVRLTPRVGQTVRVSENGRFTGFLVISAVSPKGNRVDGFYTNREKGLKWAFYRSGHESNLFVESPSIGIRLLRPLFLATE